MTTADRIAFWRQFRPRLDKLSNRIGGDQIKIRDAIYARIPIVTMKAREELGR